jgi:hypothetical protein
MIIVYENGIMIVEHPSGHIDNYTLEDVQAERENVYLESVEITTLLAELDANIISIQSSLVG